MPPERAALAQRGVVLAGLLARNGGANRLPIGVLARHVAALAGGGLRARVGPVDAPGGVAPLQPGGLQGHLLSPRCRRMDPAVAGAAQARILHLPARPRHVSSVQQHGVGPDIAVRAIDVAVGTDGEAAAQGRSAAQLVVANLVAKGAGDAIASDLGALARPFQQRHDRRRLAQQMGLGGGHRAVATHAGGLDRSALLRPSGHLHGDLCSPKGIACSVGHHGRPPEIVRRHRPTSAVPHGRRGLRVAVTAGTTGARRKVLGLHRTRSRDDQRRRGSLLGRRIRRAAGQQQANHRDRPQLQLGAMHPIAPCRRWWAA